MSLLQKPKAKHGLIHEITPQSAGWTYVGFAAHRLSKGQTVSLDTEEREAILVLVEGMANISAQGFEFGELGARMNVFDRTPPASVYVPNDSKWSVTATTDCTLAVCTAPGKGEHPARIIGPSAIKTETRGTGTNTRYINAIAMEERDVADSLLVTEVYTPAGHWSSYPPHRHDEDDDPRMTYLEETYYHRLNPAHGFGIQRVWTDDRTLDETMAVEDHDVVLVPRGYHPCAAPYGYDMYYLNVMAGPLRKWRFKNDPIHDWIAKRDS